VDGEGRGACVRRGAWAAWTGREEGAAERVWSMQNFRCGGAADKEEEKKSGARVVYTIFSRVTLW
jgi:hypothetical protein